MSQGISDIKLFSFAQPSIIRKQEGKCCPTQAERTQKKGDSLNLELSF